MKTISQTYKDNIKQLGKEITYEITYGNTTLGDEDILNANLHYDGGMLKSVMKQLDIELYNDLPIGTELNYKFGVKVDDTNYEKINYGNFIVYSSEKLEDSNTYKLVCYDKMLYAMKDYEKIHSKNLYNPTNLDFVIRNGRYSKYRNGVISNVPTASDWFSSPPPMSTTPTQEQKDIVATYGFLVKSNTQYTLSFDNPNTCHTQIQVFHYDKDLKYIKVNASSTSNNAKHTYTFTTDSNASYIMVRFDNESYDYGTAKQLNVQNIMLEKGTATNYVPYLSYPTTIRDYTTILCDNLGLTFANQNDGFTNYDKTIANELYIDNEGNNIGYTYRDVLDEIAQATASTICINDNDELEIRYITNTNEEKTSISGTSFNMTAHDNNVDIDLLGNTTQNGTPTPSSPIPVNVVSGDNKISVCGKNLFDKDNTNYVNGWIDGTTMRLNTINGNRMFYMPCKPNTTYTISRSIITSSFRTATYDSTPFPTVTGSNVDYTVSSVLKNDSGTTLTITTGANAKYLVVHYGKIEDTNLNETLATIMVVKGNTAPTTYEPYIGNTYNIDLPSGMELCKIGTYQDYIYKENGNWYKYSAIGKVVLNGSEQWGLLQETTNYGLYYMTKTDKKVGVDNLISDRFIVENSTTKDCISGRANNQALIISLAKATCAYVLSTFKTWLSTHNTIVYYVLATPTYTKIENDELIGQLEHIRLINGYNNVISSSPITLNYVSGIDTIDEEYLKDINVNFGEEVKPINTITFKRSGDTDVISLSYPEDLDDDKKNEIAISENQILNYDNRDEYLKGILDRLYGLSYCLNDYTSTGITYYDLCDRYEVSITKTDNEGNIIETNYYPCIMFNDEINVNQGLQEIVHTDRAEESITDYNTATKSDRLKTRTDLIVNKQEGFIEAVTGSLQIGEDGQSKVVNGVVSRQTETEATIKVITSYDENGNPIGVKTTKGFTFDKNGLNITSSDNTYKTQIDEQGTYYYDGDEILGQTTKEGSKFKNMDLYGEFHYGMDEITDTPLFVSMKFTDGSEECFGHFWNGS